MVELLMRWTPEMREELKERWNAGEREVDILRAMGLRRNQFLGKKVQLNLHARRGNARELSADHPAVIDGRSLFQASVHGGVTHLRPGSYSSKLGGKVTKGRWKGMAVFALTLEERATCPRDCAVWCSCYGNGMPWAKRSPHGPEFEIELWRELYALNWRHRRGFVVRLHALGDFYSPDYVNFWEAALDHFENLNVFGYTARQTSTEIGAMVQRLRRDRWERFSVRTSGAQKGTRTLVIDKVEDCPPGAIVCPAQTGRTRSCSTCGLCWHSKKPIAFVRH